MKKLILISLLALLALGIYSCEKKDTVNPTFERLEIISVDLPDTFLLGRTYEMRVTYNRPNGCTYLQGFDVIPRDRTEREVQAIGVSYENDRCTQVIGEETDQFLFQVIYPQPYTFNFWQGRDSTGNAQYLTVEIPVK